MRILGVPGLAAPAQRRRRPAGTGSPDSTEPGERAAQSDNALNGVGAGCWK